MNYFSSNSVAQRYAKGRPYFHWMIVGHIKRFFPITEPLCSALDVGCGTGLSTVALKGTAQNIIGIDASTEMIALAPRENGIKYVVASAENLPFEENEFDLLTLSQVFHWLDSNRFLAEANRGSGWIGICRFGARRRAGPRTRVDTSRHAEGDAEEGEARRHDNP